MKRFIIAIIAISSYLSSYAQMDTEFWFAVPNLSTHSHSASYRLILFSEARSANVTISMPANPSYQDVHTQVPANGYNDITIAANYTTAQTEYALPYNTISSRALYIQSDAPIYCYFQIDHNNGEAYTLKGRNALGTDFCVLSQNSMENGLNSNNTTPYHSIEIVATKNNTHVIIQPSQPVESSCTTAPITITLQQGQTYAFKACSRNGSDHLCGTRITADQPIVVNSTDDSVLALGGTGRDLVADQLTPIDHWGNEYIAVSHQLSWESVYITAIENGTIIELNNSTTLALNQGETRAVSMSSQEVLYIHSNKNVGVFQVTGVIQETGGTNLPSLNCTGSRRAKYKRLNNSIKTYVHLVTQTSNINHFSLNGSAIAPSLFKVVTGTNNQYSYALIDVTNIVPKSSLVDVACSSGFFQMGVVDGEAADNPTAISTCTYGYFSDYAEQVPILVDVNSMPVDSVYYTNRTESLSLFAHPESGFDLSNVEWTLPDGSKIYGSTLNLGAFSNNLLGEYSVTGTTTQCGVIDHPFVIKLNTVEANEYASFCEGDSFTWPNHFMPDGVTPMTFSSEGTYRDTITSASGSDSICILHLTSMPLPDMTIRPDTTIMPGDSAILWVKGVDFCRWTPENSLSKTSDNLIYAHPSQTTTYTARGYSLLSVGGSNLIYNGDFEQGNIGFNTSLNYFAPNTYHQGYGSYSISNDIIGFWKNQQESVKAYGGSGNMMIVDGSTTPNAIVWSQQVAVEPNTYYAFSAQVMSCFASHMHGQYALLQFSINGTQLGPILHSPNVLHAWTQYYEIWYSGNNTTATLTVLNQNNDGLGNDFALDNIRLDALSYSCEAIKQVIINVRGQDTDSTEIASICAGDTYTWHDKQFNTTTTITETIPNSVGGDSVCTLLLTVLEPSDSIEIATICAGKTYTWHGQTFSTSTTQTETLTNTVGCDSVCTLQLTVLPPITTDISASITEGASFTWNGQTYTAAGDYPSSFTTDEGCDSVVTLHLTVNPLTYEIQTHTQCADDPFVEFDVTADASLFHQLHFVFASNALNQHFRDTIVDFTNSLIQIPNSARAGIYDVAISTLLDNQVLDTRSYQFTLLYPSSVLDQHWDDFIGVLTHDYNGGYDFSGFQWYKDGTPIPGENHSYLYQPLEMGAAYSAMLEEADGTKLMTCDLIAVPQTEIALYPTLVQSQQIVQLHSTAEVVILLYNSLGTLVYNHSFAPGDHLFAAPVEKGVYFVKIQQTDEQGQSATKKLLVR